MPVLEGVLAGIDLVHDISQAGRAVEATLGSAAERRAASIRALR